MKREWSAEEEKLARVYTADQKRQRAMRNRIQPRKAYKIGQMHAHLSRLRLSVTEQRLLESLLD